MSSLTVSLLSKRVGVLCRFDDEAYRFSFDEAWLRDPQRPVLGQLFEDRRPYDIETSGLSCWFAHLLPQGPLRRLVAREFGVAELDDFEILRVCGEDLPGAVMLQPTETPLVERPSAGPSPPEGTALGRPRFRFSLAGAQWKLSVRPGERGLVVPVQGEAGTWIAKFHDPEHPGLPRVEYATTCWAQAAGIPTPAVRLADISEFADLPEGIPTGDGRVFLTKRFDRVETGRIHMEDFGQVLDRPPGNRQFDGAYEEIGAVLAYLSADDVRDFVERVVFCVLCGNGDAHLKNWTVVYPDGRAARLSPAYDLVSTILYHRRDELALTLAGMRSFTRVSHTSFDRLAAACQLDAGVVHGWVQDAAARTLAAWTNEASHLDFTADQRERISRHLAQLPLAC